MSHPFAPCRPSRPLYLRYGHHWRVHRSALAARSPRPRPRPRSARFRSRSFSPTCSSQVPSYISDLDSFKAKGVSDVYVVTVNDMFVVNAWKKQLLKDAGKEGAGSVKFGESRSVWVGVGVDRFGWV
jgi:hypothetical protein